MYSIGNMINGYGNQYALQAPQSLTRVTGLDGAKAYQMGPNSTVALFDSNEDIMYVKTTDGAGFPTIRTFKFEEIAQEAKEIKSDYVSQEDLQAFKKEVKNYVKFFIQQQAEPAESNAASSADPEERTGGDF